MWFLAHVVPLCSCGLIGALPGPPSLVDNFFGNE